MTGCKVGDAQYMVSVEYTDDTSDCVFCRTWKDAHERFVEERGQLVGRVEYVAVFQYVPVDPSDPSGQRTLVLAYST